MAALEIDSLVKTFDGFSALRSLDLEVPEGQFVTLLGPSGSGKTTALRCLAGLEYPTAGVITLAGRVVAAPELGLSVPPEKRGIGFVFQNYALWPHMSVRGNIEYPLKLRRINKLERRRRVDELLHTVGLTDHAGNRASDLSGGQQQRVALARALANDSPFMLYDEPLSNLDAELRTRTRSAIRAIHDRLGTTTVYVTHDQEEALSLSDRVVITNHGVIEQDGSPQEIYEQPRSAFIAGFVGFRNLVPGVSVVGADGVGRVLIDVPGFGRHGVRRRAGKSAGAAVLALRPADLVLGAPSVELSTSATVVSVSFRAGAWIVTLDLRGTAIEAQSSQEEGRPALSPGDVVTVGIRPGRGVLLPCEGAVAGKNG